MSRPFTIQKFFRLFPPLDQSDFFDYLKLPMQVKWGDINRHNISPVETAYNQLDSSQQKKAEKEMRAIFDLACPHGNECLIEMARQMNCRKFKELTRQDVSDYERSIWFWLESRKIFNAAMRFYSIDNLNWWRRRDDLPSEKPDLSRQALEGLKRSISEILQTQQGRGRNCTVEFLDRKDMIYLFAYPDDFITRYETHDGRGKLRSRRIRPTFTVGFAYSPDEGTLELSMDGSSLLKEKFEQAFAREILAVDLATWKRFVSYELDHLKDPSTILETDKVDQVSARIRKLRFKVYGSQRRISLQVDESDSYDSIHTMIRDCFHPQNLKLEDLMVDQATLHFEFLPKARRRTGKISVNIGHPNFCNFRNTHQDWEDLIRKYLKRWRILRGQSVDSDIETMGSQFA